MPSYHRLHNEAPERVAMFSFCFGVLGPSNPRRAITDIALTAGRQITIAGGRDPGAVWKGPPKGGGRLPVSFTVNRGGLIAIFLIRIQSAFAPRARNF